MISKKYIAACVVLCAVLVLTTVHASPISDNPPPVNPPEDLGLIDRIVFYLINDPTYGPIVKPILTTGIAGQILQFVKTILSPLGIGL